MLENLHSLDILSSVREPGDGAAGDGKQIDEKSVANSFCETMIWLTCLWFRVSPLFPPRPRPLRTRFPVPGGSRPAAWPPGCLFIMSKGLFIKSKELLKNTQSGICPVRQLKGNFCGYFLYCRLRPVHNVKRLFIMSKGCLKIFIRRICSAV